MPIPDPGDEAVAAAARAAGCASPAAGDPAADDPAEPAAERCHVARPYHPESVAECTATWCGNDVRPIRSCAPVPMNFAGGYHYVLAGEGYDADFFFFPVGEPSNPTPLKENFGWVQLRLDLGVTLDPPQPVVMVVYLSSDEAFAAGLDVVDGTIIGALELDALASAVQGPLYQPSCDFVTDEIGRVVPGECACRFPTASILVPLYVPLGSLLGQEPVDVPIAPDGGVMP